jgi:small subunit ribosomal protein S18b
VEEVEGEEDPNGEAPKTTEPPRDPATDRSVPIPLDVSLRYMESNAYKETYGDTPVWVMYRRNFKGQFAPKQTRRTCVREGVLTTRNPCPICRDEYLVLDYRNVKLLKQFISPFTGQVLHWDKTGLCRTKQLDLLVEIEKARDYGTISFDVPIRKYDYDDYYGNKPRNYL